MKNRSFARTMAVYAAVFLGIVFVFALLQWRWLSEYEGALSQNVIDSYIETLSADNVRESCERSLGSLDSNIQSVQDAFEEYVRPYFSGVITYKKDAANSSESSESYVIFSGDTEIGRVVLQQEDTPVTLSSRIIKGHEIYKWRVVSENYDFSFLDTGKTAQISVPMEYYVECRGYRLGTRYITSKDNHYDGLEYLLDYGIELPYMATYTVSHFLGDVNFSVYDSAGNPVDQSDNYANLLINNCTDAEMSRLDTFIRSFCNYYIAYMGSPRGNIYANFENLKPYLLSGSEYAQRLSDSLEGMVWSNNKSNELTDLTINYCINAGNGNYISEVDYCVKSMGASNEYVSTKNYVRIFVKWNENGLYAYDMTAYKNAEVVNE